MIPLTIMVCTLGLPVEMGPDHEHCYFYDVEIHVPVDKVPMKIMEFCAMVDIIAMKRGGTITKCKVVLAPEKPDDRRSRNLRA